MTRRYTVAALILGAAALTFAAPAPPAGVTSVPLAADQQDEIVLELSNPANHPRVGVPNFILAAADAEITAASATITDVLWSDLDFEREYYMIPRASSASIPSAQADALPFDRWTAVGADYVLVGYIARSGQNLSIELRMIATRGERQGRQVFGARYPNCRAQNPRACAHAIADDVHKQTRQLDGVARTRLAFTSDRDATRVTGRPAQTPGEGKEIYLADYDGANQVRFTVNRHINISPAWSPTGNLLAYVSYMSSFPDVYVANLAEPGRGLQRPAAGSDRVQNFLPSWSPDGTKLAFMSTRSGNNDIWVVNRDGSGLTNLTNNPANDWAPTWSPNGAQIAFASDRLGANQLWVMSSTGTAPQRLFSDRIDRPTWSPLNFIAFTIGSGPGYDIGIYDFNNPGNVRVLTDGVGSNESPAVAPNGRHIAFVTTRWGRQHIATIDRTGENIRRITEVGNNTYPNWQPIPGR